MSIRKFFIRNSTVLIPKLHSEVAAVAAIEGVAYTSERNEVGVDFMSDPSAPLMTQVQSIITAHDATDYEAISRTADYADLLAMAEQGLAQIVTDLSDVQAGTTAANADKVTLTGTPTQAQVLSVVRRMLDRELVLYADCQHILTRQNKIIRVLRHVVKS